MVNDLSVARVCEGTYFYSAQWTPFSVVFLFEGSSWRTGNPGSVIVPQYGSSKITVFVWGKNTILKFLGNTK